MDEHKYTTSTAEDAHANTRVGKLLSSPIGKHTITALAIGSVTAKRAMLK